MRKTSMEQIMGIKAFLKQNMSMEGKSVEQLRQEQAASQAQAVIPEGTITEKTTIAGMNAEWVKAANVVEHTKEFVLYFHGGGFVTGSCDTHRELAARISKASAVPVLVIEYRLAPEYTYPAANEDCIAAYRWLLSNGFSEKNIVLGGESTGGYLVLETLLTLRDAGEPLPRAAFLLSPHTDFLYYNGKSYITRANSDPMSSLYGTQKCAERYFTSSLEDRRALCPLMEDLSLLPSLFIQVGDHEVILDDSTRLAARAEEAGVAVTLEVWENMWHIFRFMAAMLPEGQQAIDNIGEFIKSQLN
ncbi:MAG: alpha/beta hydrolase [Bacillota bacterium]|nr:alpha/beta hydrolase [Bacillota bacterium]